jgi:hypothetical protein
METIQKYESEGKKYEQCGCGCVAFNIEETITDRVTFHIFCVSCGSKYTSVEVGK